MALGVVVDFTANIARFSSQVDRIASDLDRFQQRAETMSSRVSKAFGALGIGLSVAGITSFIKSGIDAADTLNDMSLKTGIAVEQLAGFQVATKQSGTDMEAFTSAANKLSVNIAKNGEAFKKLGISAKDPAEAFLQLADVFSSIEDPQQRAALAAKALGKSWQDMAPLLSMGGAGLRAAVTEGTRLTGVTTEMAKQADQFNDTLETMYARMGSLATIVGGSFAQGFNQLIEKIDQATQSGVTFNNVMTGIGNFAFQNVFDDVERIGTVSTRVNEINDRIIKARDNLDKAKSGPIDSLRIALGDTSKVQEAEQAINDLLLERDQIIIHLGESRKQAQAGVAAPSAKTVTDFIGGGDGGEASSKVGTGRVGTGRDQSLQRTKTAVDQLQKSYESMVESMNKEIALRFENSEAAKMDYEIQVGAFRDLNENQKIKLLNLAAEKDALEKLKDVYQEYDDIISEGVDLAKKQRDVTTDVTFKLNAKFNQPREDFVKGMEDAKLAKKLGVIDTDQMEKEFARLRASYADFTDGAQSDTEKLSEFGIQAARNMQTSFADFLFDPFSQSMGGLLDGFITTLRRMAAEAAAAMIFDSLKKNGAEWIDSLVSVFSTVAGAAGGASGKGAVGGNFSFAKGNAFNNGNVMAFAGGGVVNSATNFPMAGGKTGLMGEAGPEAIMPLSRDSAGRLGIKAQNQAPSHNITVIVQGNNNAPDVRRSAGQGAREALGLINGASRYG